MEKEAKIQVKSDVKVNSNTQKEEKNMEKVIKRDEKVDSNAIIMDAKPETKAKTKALNSKKEAKVDKKKKTPAKKEAKVSNKKKITSKPKKGGGKMSHNESLAKVLEVTAKKEKDLNYNVKDDRSGVPSTFQLRRGGDNIVTIRKTDIVACRPREFFSKTLLNKTPYFKLFDKKAGVESFTHFTHIKKAVEVDVFKAIVAKAITSKKTVGEWKTKMNAIGKSRVSKKTDRQKMADLQVSIKRQQAELKALKAAKAKVKKPAKAKAKVAPAIAKVAESIA
jgi:hypothetical protein